MESFLQEVPHWTVGGSNVCERFWGAPTSPCETCGALSTSHSLEQSTGKPLSADHQHALITMAQHLSKARRALTQFKSGPWCASLLGGAIEAWENYCEGRDPNNDGDVVSSACELVDGLVESPSSELMRYLALSENTTDCREDAKQSFAHAILMDSMIRSISYLDELWLRIFYLTQINHAELFNDTSVRMLDFLEYFEMGVSATLHATWLPTDALPHAKGLCQFGVTKAGGRVSMDSDFFELYSHCLKWATGRDPNLSIELQESPNNPLFNFHILTSLESLLLFRGSGLACEQERQWDTLCGMKKDRDQNDPSCTACGVSLQPTAAATCAFCSYPMCIRCSRSCVKCSDQICSRCSQKDEDAEEEEEDENEEQEEHWTCPPCQVTRTTPTLAVWNDVIRQSGCQVKQTVIYYHFSGQGYRQTCVHRHITSYLMMLALLVCGTVREGPSTDQILQSAGGGDRCWRRVLGAPSAIAWCAMRSLRHCPTSFEQSTAD